MGGKIHVLMITGTNEKNYLALPLDVTDNDAITSAIKKAQEKFGRLDVVVNNAFVALLSFLMTTFRFPYADDIYDMCTAAAMVSAANSSLSPKPRFESKWRSTSSA